MPVSKQLTAEGLSSTILRISHVPVISYATQLDKQEI
jgi:hypothetical protein